MIDICTRTIHLITANVWRHNATNADTENYAGVHTTVILVGTEVAAAADGAVYNMVAQKYGAAPSDCPFIDQSTRFFQRRQSNGLSLPRFLTIL